jgi:hypothetical protein
MRLDFNVLWIDDQPERVKAQIEAITRHMQEHGFDFFPRQCRTLEDVAQSLADDVFDDEIDLVLVDWDLGGGVQGQDAISNIREKIRYKDVVFYSAGKEPKALRQLAFDNDLEGVYCASRELLVEEVLGVFDALVKKVLDLDHTRGIVMGATSDIDHIVGECLDCLHRNASPEEQAALFEKAVKLVRKTLESSAKELEQLNDTTSFDELSKQHRIFTAHHRLRVLKGALKFARLDDLKLFEEAIVTYMEKVTPERNILGHVLLVPAGKPKYVLGADEKPKSLEDTRDLRRTILGLRLQFRQLHTLLVGVTAKHPTADNPGESGAISN